MMFMLLNCLPEAGEVCLADGELLLDDVLPVGGVDVDAVLDDARVAVSVGHEEMLRVVRHGDRGGLAVVHVVVAGLELEEED